MRIYLDNCCYNRPYDDQSQLRISLESQAKLYVQELIREDKFELVTSYMLTYENSKNRFEIKRKAITQFIEENASVYVDASNRDKVEEIAKEIQATGVKPADALHTACAILAHCDYLLTTDDRLLKYRTDKIRIIDPPGFIREIGGVNDEHD